ncbi:hypothetical protein ACIBQ1_09685 [Nonomuraea sp. NPDC050153]|uniref:hypothetical protein n=1 Tax=Nonomuraea sp. NPDC050153 TaxID=3364359 RepID=UPI00379775B7
MSLMGNHGYDETADLGEIQGAQDDAEYFARTVDEARSLTPDERAERLLESARQDRAHERALADRFGWR